MMLYNAMPMGTMMIVLKMRMKIVTAVSVLMSMLLCLFWFEFCYGDTYKLLAFFELYLYISAIHTLHKPEAVHAARAAFDPGDVLLCTEDVASFFTCDL